MSLLRHRAPLSYRSLLSGEDLSIAALAASPGVPFGYSWATAASTASLAPGRLAIGSAPCPPVDAPAIWPTP